MIVNDALYKRISNLIEQKLNNTCISITPIAGAGSPREYFKIITENSSIIACKGVNAEENNAFIALANFFKQKGLAVPNLLAVEEGNMLYLVEDIGDIDLLSYVKQHSEKEIYTIYCNALRDLLSFQIVGKEINNSIFFARPVYDTTYMKWDLSYFKYYYLKLTDIEFSEQKLENDFDTLLSFLSQADNSFFMYRDFQARNIFIQNEKLRYIDFQGGMKGPLQYDVVSLLYQAKANLSETMKSDLRTFYIKELQQKYPVDYKKWNALFEGFVFIRILQTLGAYGYRGIIQNKEHFISSIPQAVHNLKQQLSIIEQIIEIPYLSKLLQNLPIITK